VEARSQGRVGYTPEGKTLGEDRLCSHRLTPPARNGLSGCANP
jgi:hypothetical protein